MSIAGAFSIVHLRLASGWNRAKGAQVTPPHAAVSGSSSAGFVGPDFLPVWGVYPIAPAPELAYGQRNSFGDLITRAKQTINRSIRDKTTSHPDRTYEDTPLIEPGSAGFWRDRPGCVRLAQKHDGEEDAVRSPSATESSLTGRPPPGADPAPVQPPVASTLHRRQAAHLFRSANGAD
jgi:hypothetical protein